MDDAGYDSDGDLVLSLVPGLAEGLSAAAAAAEAYVLSSSFLSPQFDDGHALEQNACDLSLSLASRAASPSQFCSFFCASRIIDNFTSQFKTG